MTYAAALGDGNKTDGRGRDGRGGRGKGGGMNVEQEMEDLRDRWVIMAWGIESTRGAEDPGAKAYRQCVGDAWKIQERIAEQRKAAEKETT